MSATLIVVNGCEAFEVKDGNGFVSLLVLNTRQPGAAAVRRYLLLLLLDAVAVSSLMSWDRLRPEIQDDDIVATVAAVTEVDAAVVAHDDSTYK